MRRTSWLVAALCAAVLALYAASLRFPPVFDDGILTPEFLRAYGRSWFKLDPRWFAYASFGWTYELFGPDRLWLRLGNVLIHAATAALIFVFLRRLFRCVLGGDEGRWTAFVGAALFALHPLAVYATAYVVQRSILMATFFSVAALACLLEGLLRRSRGWLAASAAAYFVAVFSKEHAAALLGVAAALVVMLRGVSWRNWKDLWWLLACWAAVAAVIVLKKKGLLGAVYEPFAEAVIWQMAESEPSAGAANAAAADASRLDLYLRSVANQALLFFRYLGTWLLPYPGWMSIDVRTAFPGSAASPACAAALAAWVAWPVAALALLLRGGRRALAGFGLLAPWVLALPEFATVRVQEPFVLYRSYLWMSLLPAALAGPAPRLPARRAALALGIAVAVLAPLTLERLRSFSSAFAVWDDAVRKNANRDVPLVERAYRNRGVALYREGQYSAALADFERALELNPRSAQGWMTRGTLFMRTGESAKALADFDRALELAPRDAEVLGRRCVVLMRLQRLEAALADCLAARELNPYDALAHVSLGMAHALRGEAASAEESYRRALALDPYKGDAHYQYGVLLQGTGRTREASEHFLAACRAGTPKACEAVKLIQ